MIVIRGGTILDGTGGEPFTGDVAIDGDRIEAVGSVPPAEGVELDATGLNVAPGFVDLHSHSDYTLLVDPRAASAIHQGVTLEVVGNCGFGCFPIRDAELARKAIYGYSPDVPIDWTSAGGYFERLQAAKPAVNVLSLVPNGQLRLATVGLAERAADTRELEEMKALLRESLGEGAWGYSTGLEYAQEAGAPEEEVGALAAAMSPSGGLYATHTRRRDEARPTRSPRRCASPSPRRHGCRSRTSCRATGSRSRAARWRSSSVRGTAGSTSSSTCTRGSTD